MEEIVNLIGSDSSASEISDKIKDALYAKASGKIDSMRPSVASLVFDTEQSEEG